jgi:hypothetical protein
MKTSPVRIIVAVESAILRQALLETLQPIGCCPEVISPDLLLSTHLSGINLIFLETNNEVERLIATAQALWARFEECEAAGLHILSYSTPDVTTDSIVSRLWSIGPELTVIVQTWEADCLTQTQKEARSFALRMLSSHSGAD